MIVGTSDEVRDKLKGMLSRRIVAFSIEGENNPEADVLAETIANFILLVSTILDRRENNAILAILDTIVPAVPPPPHKLFEARMTAQARKGTIENGDWLTASEVAELAGLAPAILAPSRTSGNDTNGYLLFAIKGRITSLATHWTPQRTIGLSRFWPTCWQSLMDKRTIGDSRAGSPL
jgi:hypothetical protein